MTEETPGQMLDRLGMDGVKWAAEFRKTAMQLGYSDMDEGWLIGWFANAIMAGYDRAPRADLSPSPEGVKELLEVAVADGFYSAAPGEWLVFDIKRVKDAIIAAALAKWEGGE